MKEIQWRATKVQEEMKDANLEEKSVVGLRFHKFRSEPAENAETHVEVIATRLGPVWRAAISGVDRGRAFRALEVTTLFSLRRAVRNGSVWIEHSLSFRGRARLFFTETRWQEESKRHYARLSLSANAATFLKPLLAKVRTGVDAVAVAARSGVLRVDDKLHLSVLLA